MVKNEVGVLNTLIIEHPYVFFCYNPSTLYIPHRFAATVTLDQLDLPLFQRIIKSPFSQSVEYTCHFFFILTVTLCLCVDCHQVSTCPSEKWISILRIIKLYQISNISYRLQGQKKYIFLQYFSTLHTCMCRW